MNSARDDLNALKAASAPESEAALIGALLRDDEDRRYIVEAMDLLRGPGDFTDAKLGTLYHAIGDLHAEGAAPNSVRVYQRLRDIGVDDQFEIDCFDKLLGSAVSASEAPYYARIVAGKARQRRIIEAIERARGRAVEPATDASALAHDIEEIVFEATQDRQSRQARPAGEIANGIYDALSSGETPASIPTGYAEIDALVNGLKPTELIVLAARPSMGKTALAANIACQAAAAGTPTAILSIEMAADPVVIRILSHMTGIRGDRLQVQGLDAKDFDALAHATGRLGDWPLYIDDDRNIDVRALRSKARWLVAMHGVKLLFVDYLQLIDGPGENRAQQVAQVSRALKSIAQQFDLAVVALSQLNRLSAGRDDHRPLLSDLRDSGSIEQDADVVLLLHREDYYHRHDDSYQPTELAEIDVAKQRNGPIGSVKLRFDGSLSRFTDTSVIRQEPHGTAQ